MTPATPAMDEKETLEQELRRLIGEYQDDDAGDATKCTSLEQFASARGGTRHARMASIAHTQMVTTASPAGTLLPPLAGNIDLPRKEADDERRFSPTASRGR